MKTLYLECNMGAAGDMLMAALLELHDDPEDFIGRLNAVGIPDTVISAEPSVKQGIRGTHIKVEIKGEEEQPAAECEETHEHHAHEHGRHETHDHERHACDSHVHAPHDVHDVHHVHSHNSYPQISHLINHLNISATVKKDALAVYRMIAEAESHVHGVPVDSIHFHEVGELDAIADIVGVCMLMEELAPDLILASPIHVGSGQIRCAHGILPVPAPATAELLRDIPIFSGQVKGELCTPTGAALLKYFVKDFGSMPVLSVSRLGYGMGKKDFENANCVRAFFGSTADTREDVAELVCNLDDMTPEAVAFAQQLLLEEGALDVYTTHIGMKKGRPGLSFTCMCHVLDKERMLSLIFKHTSTLGIREYITHRYTLQKEHKQIQTKFGIINIKTSSGYGVKKTKPEYEDIARIAREREIAIEDILEEIER